MHTLLVISGFPSMEFLTNHQPHHIIINVFTNILDNISQRSESNEIMKHKEGRSVEVDAQW